MVAVFGLQHAQFARLDCDQHWTQQVACIPPVEDAMPEISDSAVVQ